MESQSSARTQISPQLLSVGGTGFTFRLNEFIAVKKVRPGQHSDFANEQATFTMLERYAPSPYIIQNFYRIEDAIFLEYATHGDVASLLREEQQREEATRKVIRVSKTQPLDLCLVWMKQLCAAAAWLETLSLAHGDIRPENMLLCSARHIKLADFDRTLRIGDDLVGTEPFARLVSDEDDLDYGTHGKAGSRTEQFAIGSVFYSLTRGYDPFEDEWWGPDHGLICMERLQRMEFPSIGHVEYDGIIESCWHGRYKSIAELAADLNALGSDAWEVVDDKDPLWVEARRHECETIANSEILEKLFVY